MDVVGSQALSLLGGPRFHCCTAESEEVSGFPEDNINTSDDKRVILTKTMCVSQTIFQLFQRLLLYSTGFAVHFRL